MASMSTELRSYGLYIGGEEVDAASGDVRETIDPATGQPWAVVAEANADDVDRAVQTAKAALRGPWAEVLPRERGELLRRVADLIVANAARLIELEVHDNGKTIRELQGHYTHIPSWFRYFAALADKIDGRVLPVERHGIFTYTMVEPIGVVAGITPWNSPGLQVAFKTAPALAAGNTVVLKPSEHTPVVTLEMAKLFEEAGFPPGVVNVVSGGAAAGAALSSHPDVDLVVFTGSDAVGRKVGSAAGNALSDVVLELGGKSPQLVFADADLDVATTGIAAGVCTASGQTCIAGSRAYVEESIADELLAALADRFSSLKIGNPMDMATEVGPVCFEGHLERLEQFCADAVSEGAVAVTGGQRSTTNGNAHGFYFEPTIFSNVTNDMRLMRDEAFGPIIGITTFSDEAEAVRLANDTRFGLAAGIWSTDVRRVHRLTHQLEAGTIFVNNYRMSSPQTPLMGFKDSGVGMENGQDALRNYTRTKAVWLDYSGAVKDPFKM